LAHYRKALSVTRGISLHHARPRCRAWVSPPGRRPRRSVQLVGFVLAFILVGSDSGDGVQLLFQFLDVVVCLVEFGFQLRSCLCHYKSPLSVVLEKSETPVLSVLPGVHGLEPLSVFGLADLLEKSNSLMAFGFRFTQGDVLHLALILALVACDERVGWCCSCDKTAAIFFW